MTAAGNVSLHNLWFRFADMAVAAPYAGRLDVWDCQFLECNVGVINEYGGTDGFHNVLFAGCYDAVDAFTNNFSITAEHVTAYVPNLWEASIAPDSVSLTNSILLGPAAAFSGPGVVVNPDLTNFQGSGAGDYYLAANSPLHGAGTTNVSPQLLNEFQQKTTYPPLALPALMSLSGSLTLAPLIPRYTNGAPDIGYYYDALDYTVAGLTNFGSLTVLPGTVVGLREDISIPSVWGFDLRENSSFVSHGTPVKPVIFVDVQRVQEQFTYPCYGDFVPDFQSPDTNAPGPALDFRFCHFYPAVGWYQVWAGNWERGGYWASYDSVVNWTMQDCELHGGNINLGEPRNAAGFYGSGAVTWNNNLFENTHINLQPTYDWRDGTVNVDLAFQAHNNLFRAGGHMLLVPVPASAGNWNFTDNLFDQVEFYQITSLPLDFDYNAYWPLKALFYTVGQFQLQPSTGGNQSGANDKTLTAAPRYQTGPLGNYYLPTTTLLHDAGSRLAADAGLAQYTTQVNQTKDTGQVDIGLHYVATSSSTSATPKDTDGDFIPDYVEDANGNGDPNDISAGIETSPSLAQTTTGVADSANTIYDDVDLDGDGMVGRIEKALGKNPLFSDNPLTLTQVITGNEPNVITFKVPISYALVDYNSANQIGKINVLIDGMPLSVGCKSDGNGQCLLTWDATFSPPGLHVLQAEFILNTMLNPGSTRDPTVIAATGPLITFTNQNCAQFDPFYCQYSDSHGAILYATTPTCPDATYTIELQTPDGNHIK